MSTKNNTEDGGKIINFNQFRKEKLEERRRQYERILFRHILGAYCVAEGEGLKAIELVDLSETGISFQLPYNSKNLDSVTVGKDFNFRLYFSADTYIPIRLTVQNKRECIEEHNRYFRFGCSLDTETQSYTTYKLFVQFLTKYAETSQQDKGDLKVFYF